MVVNVCTERWAELGDARPTSDASTSPPTVIALKAVDSEAQRSAYEVLPVLNFTVGDLDATVGATTSFAGAVLDGPIRYPPRVRVAALRAPDGHMLGLFEPAEGI